MTVMTNIVSLGSCVPEHAKARSRSREHCKSRSAEKALDEEIAKMRRKMPQNPSVSPSRFSRSAGPGKERRLPDKSIMEVDVIHRKRALDDNKLNQLETQLAVALSAIEES